MVAYCLPIQVAGWDKHQLDLLAFVVVDGQAA